MGPRGPSRGRGRSGCACRPRRRRTGGRARWRSMPPAPASRRPRPCPGSRPHGRPHRAASCSRSSPWSSMTTSTPSPRRAPTSPNLSTLPPARPGVADEDRALRRGHRQWSTGVAFVQVAGDRGSSEAGRGHHEHGGDHDREHRAVSMRFGPDHGADNEHGAESRAGDTDNSAGCPLGDDPPGAGDDQRHADQSNHEKAQVADREDHDRHDEQDARGERCHGKGPLAPADLVRPPFHASSEAEQARPRKGPSSLRPAPVVEDVAGRPAVSTCPGRAGIGTGAPGSRPRVDDQGARPACASATGRGSGSAGG